ncbi:DUF72 domain-containing protein [Microbulbifer harenosus]|uniref:DUF72 domain-containing protein n=1 Tax=Microbulbifer harenosus TaxID=2576840 RepID=A0ABY2UKB6_9GAMM|nr:MULTISPECIES: DUF72 domain-containing protein [Microbulbifer]QIL89385.1 DUF72 domain-containing protein [Microbulbifer sp. SH-1]TLM78687.1 DUF72 domain-containing protein [Microbulbifer harenosus]
MKLPYFLGCPQWQHPAWHTRLPAGATPLERHSQLLNCVEGNTTFYATPTQAQFAGAPVAGGCSTGIRYIGHPDLENNRPISYSSINLRIRTY